VRHVPLHSQDSQGIFIVTVLTRQPAGFLFPAPTVIAIPRSFLCVAGYR
jgi:hypothetical protein